MAIKAKAEITISRIIDVENVIRYYLLQSSSIAAPSKPTANPPGGSWSTTEPTYNSGATNSLYFTNLTIMSNGTYSYSAVSKSSSYEAAKEAWNKANNAQDGVGRLTTRVESAETSISKNNEEIALRAKKTEVTEAINNIDIGGRNLARKTSNEWGRWYSPLNKNNCVEVISLIYPGPRSVGDVFMLSFDIDVKKFTGSGDGPFALYLQGDVDGSWGYGNPFTNYNFATKALAGDYTEHVSYTCKIANTYQAKAVCFQLLYRCDYSDGTGKFRIRNLKVEKGNKATDWTPAPEDYYTKTETDASIQVLSDKISQQVSTTDKLGTRLSKVEQDSSSWSVTLETANAAKNTADAANKTASNANSTASEAKKTADSANTTAGQAKSTADNASQTASSAKSAADKANENASSAVSTANTAKSTADTAKSTADTARQEASDAAKTATNFMGFDSNGLVVGDRTANTLGKNVLIGNDEIDIRNGTTNYARFAETLIELGLTKDFVLQILNKAIRFIGKDSETAIAHIGYGDCLANNDDDDGNMVTRNQPYYTFGERRPYYKTQNGNGRAALIGEYSCAEGFMTIAEGPYSHVEGLACCVEQVMAAHAEGYGTYANGDYAHTEGLNTAASGSASHAEGSGSLARGYVSHAEGENTQATGEHSHASGYETIASGNEQTVIGRYNTDDASQLFIIGNGSANDARKNAFTVSETGDITSTGNTVQLIKNGNLVASYDGTTPVLLSTAVYPNADYTGIFSAPASTQPHGILIEFAPYADGQAKGYGLVTFFIPKGRCNGESYNIYIDPWCSKWIYVYDNKIVGNDANSKTGTTNGISYNNRKYVLSRVYGV